MVYGASGMHVTACRVVDEQAIVEHQLNWAAAQTTEEAQYLCAVLNSVAVTKAVEPFMTSGKGGGHHINSYLWRLPIPLYNAEDELHKSLADLGDQAEHFVASLEVRPAKAHGAMRAKSANNWPKTSLAEKAVGSLLDQAIVLSS